MDMKRFLKGVSIFLILTFWGCDITDDGPSFNFVSLEITAVDVPDSFELYGTYPIGITYLRPNSCTSFEGFDIVKEDYSTRRVVAVGAEFPDSDCSGGAEEITTSFDFKCLYNGTYYFKFYAGDDADGTPQFIEVEVPVE